ncbi:ABC transporter ATP-binding protein [Natronosporangium hydrolyticum]|uniref:ABC transporter ATP-binding protein n=1 Tax=Natronosporangium hydrolyticum TaxID=2811111 RepID=A0A895YL25_9ACTN|nr:ABC transporter ATP-binding protein [Natronosporangium hydrolyticum]QSB16702.1 ABC transporter ATP-binding protein [Natronosporangium hydrolyticum]
MTISPPHTASPSHPVPSLAADQLSLGYRDKLVVDGVSVTLPQGRITTVVGANGCGKSTLLRGLARLLRPQSGRVLLDGADLSTLPARTLARQLGLLPQQPIAPDGITVADLIGRGRHPHQRWFRQWSTADDQAVAAAMQATGVAQLSEQPIDELSGGQRQRVWIALALAQDPEIMLLDEPTTYLDLAHQIEVLELLVALNRRLGRTIVLVLHDINMACRYTHHLIAMRDGQITAEGAPAEIVTAELIKEVFSVTCTVIPDPLAGTPLILPQPGVLPG